jgi:hypothetical protein
MKHLIDYTNPVKLDGELKDCRKDYGCVTSEFAMDCLYKTNYVANMRFIANNIFALDENEWIKYKDFVLEAIEGRSQADDVFNVFFEMAKKGNYLEQFVAAHQKEKIYGVADKVLVSDDRHHSDTLGDCDVLVATNDCTYFSDMELSKVVIFKNTGDITFRNCGFRHTKSLIFSRNDNGVGKCLYMNNCGDFPKSLDMSYINQSVDISHCDFKGVENIAFAQVLFVKMIDSKNFPQKLDFSSVDMLYLDDSDFRGVKSIVFGECGKVDLSGAKGLPKVLDLSKCKNLVLDGCDFEGVETIYIKDEEDAMLIRDGINFENVDVLAGPRKTYININNVKPWWAIR